MDIFTECFFNLSHTLNFTETARQLFISQQAVSKNIAKLEKKVGFPLFYRSPHGVELTPWGKDYLDENTLFIDTCDRIRQNYNPDNHTIRISTSPISRLSNRSVHFLLRDSRVLIISRSSMIPRTQVSLGF